MIADHRQCSIVLRQVAGDINTHECGIELQREQDLRHSRVGADNAVLGERVRGNETLQVQAYKGRSMSSVLRILVFCAIVVGIL